MIHNRFFKFMLAFTALFGLIVGYGISLHFTFTSNYQGANDFLIPWYATRALLWEGRDPYGSEVTAEIQTLLFGQVRKANQHQFDFAYPLTVVPFLAPYTILPYTWAQPLWQATLHVLIVAAIVLWLKSWLTQLPSPLVFAGLLLWSLSLYPVARAFILGQLAVLVFGAVAFALWALQKKHDELAGAMLAITTIKPQLSFILVPTLLFLTWYKGRKRIAVTFGIVLAALVLNGLYLQPDWPLAFIQRLQEYSHYTSLGQSSDSTNIIELVIRLLAIPYSETITWLLIGGLVLFLIFLLALWSKKSNPNWIQITCATLTISAFVVPRTALTDQILLLFPWLWLLSQLPRLQSTLLALALWIVFWGLFLGTVQGDTEALVMHLLFPPTLLVVWLWIELRKQKRV